MFFSTFFTLHKQVYLKMEAFDTESYLPKSTEIQNYIQACYLRQKSIFH